MKNMTVNDEITVGIAATVAYTVTEVVPQVVTAAMGIVTTTGEMRVLRTVTQGDPGLNEMVALLPGLLPHHLGLPLGAQALDTMTTGDEILPHHHHDPTTTAPGGQTCRPRMALLGVSKKTCTEGMVGLTEEETILNGKCTTCVTCQKPQPFSRRRQQRDNNTFSIWPPSPRAPARELCGFSTLLGFVVADLFIVGHQNDAKNHAKSTNEDVPRLSRPRQQIVKRIVGVVKEKKGSARGGKKTETDDHDDLEDHDLVRTTKPPNAVAIAGGNAAGRPAASVARLGLQCEAHPASSQTMTKTNG